MPNIKEIMENANKDDDDLFDAITGLAKEIKEEYAEIKKIVNVK